MVFRGGTPRGAPRRLSRSNSQCSCCSETSSGSRGRFGQGVGYGSAPGGLGRGHPGIVESLQNFTLNPDEYYYSMTNRLLKENTQFGIRRDLPEVILPKFLTKQQGRWVIQDSGPVELPLEREVTTILLAVDKEDVMYFRNVEPEEYNKIDPSSFNFMYKTLQSFYSDCKYQLQACIGQTNCNWVPIVGEVVVVQVGKVSEVNSPPRKLEHFNETIPGYERAVVIRLDRHNGVFVDLLDDYGKGWVKPVECFKIKDFFTYAPAQKYACELPGLDLIHPNHVLGSVLKRFPIKGICVRRTLNHMNIKWTGDKSPSGNPLVTVTVNVQMNTTVNLRQHVFRNLPKFLDPRANLRQRHASKDHWSMGRILDINKNGFMHLRLNNNDLMLMTIRECLDSLGEVSRDLALKPEHLKTNLGTGKESDIYIVKLSGVEEERDPNEKPFYRVIIVEKKGTEVLIQCLDHLVLRQTSLDELIPLGRVYPDLKYIPPLVCRVHLHTIKKITDLENVKSLFAHRLVRIRLVRAYPFHLCPPQVFIDVGWKDPDDDDFERNAEMPETCSLAAWIIKKGWAEEADPVFMSSYDALVNAEVEKKEKLRRVKGYHPIYKSGEPDKKFDKFMKQRMFTGELIQFQRRVKRREIRRLSQIEIQSYQTFLLEPFL